MVLVLGSFWVCWGFFLCLLGVGGHFVLFSCCLFFCGGVAFFP